MTTQGDSESRQPAPPGRDLWALPEIRSLTIERVRYRSPRRHAVAGEVVEFDEGVEITLETNGEIPIRALSPALHVGSTELAENEQVDATSYRFFVLDEAAVRSGDPITLGWAGHPPAKAKADFRYEAPAGTVTR
jgi:hypothetical protein